MTICDKCKKPVNDGMLTMDAPPVLSATVRIRVDDERGLRLDLFVQVCQDCLLTLIDDVRSAVERDSGKRSIGFWDGIWEVPEPEPTQQETEPK